MGGILTPNVVQNRGFNSNVVKYNHLIDLKNHQKSMKLAGHAKNTYLFHVKVGIFDNLFRKKAI